MLSGGCRGPAREVLLYYGSEYIIHACNAGPMCNTMRFMPSCNSLEGGGEVVVRKYEGQREGVQFVKTAHYFSH